MPSNDFRTPRPVSRALKILGSVFAIAHLVAITLNVLAAPSGPWPSYVGPTPMTPPVFASTITMSISQPYYLQPLRMIDTYHFKSNLIAPYAAYFEVRLKNEAGDVFKTLKFPDEKANFWVRHRQKILAQGLAEDEEVRIRTTEAVAPNLDNIPKVELWMMEGDMLRLKKMPEHEVPRMPPPIRPSEGAKLLAEAYMRYLCREHKAASAELIRVSRGTVTPTDMIDSRPRGPDFFKELKSDFGEYRVK